MVIRLEYLETNKTATLRETKIYNKLPQFTLTFMKTTWILTLSNIFKIWVMLQLLSIYTQLLKWSHFLKPDLGALYSMLYVKWVNNGVNYISSGQCNAMVLITLSAIYATLIAHINAKTNLWKMYSNKSFDIVFNIIMKK